MIVIKYHQPNDPESFTGFEPNMHLLAGQPDVLAAADEIVHPALAAPSYMDNMDTTADKGYYNIT